MKKPNESDWRHFRDSLAEWRERYLEKINPEIADILASDEGTPTEKFWKAKEEMDRQARILQDCLDGYSRSKMWRHLLLMYRHGLVDETDLEAFSDELREDILYWESD